MKKLILGIGLFSVLACNTLSAKEGVNEVNKRSQSTNNGSNVILTETEYSQEQLAQMLAPVALYPDSLLTHILIASTYPIEVVEAERWISKNKDLSSNRIANKLEDKTWEASVKALVMFPDVLERLSDNLSWTQQLGDAFLQNEENVLQAIQNLRYQAAEAGSLNKMENVEVSRENNNIIIEPVEKEIVYVPYYDSRHVYGHWHSLLYPAIFWDWGHRVRFSKHRPFGWNAGIHISWNYFFSGFHWSNRHVVVINHRNTRHYKPKKVIVRNGYSNRWVHKPQHRKGVRYTSKKVNNRYSGHRSSSNKKVIVRNDSRYKANKHEVVRNKIKTNKAASQQKFKNKSQKQSDKRLNTQRSVAKQNKTYSNKAKAQRSHVNANKKVEKTVVRNTQATKQVKSVKRERAAQSTSKRAQRTEVNRTSNRSQSKGQRQSKREQRN